MLVFIVLLNIKSSTTVAPDLTISNVSKNTNIEHDAYAALSSYCLI